MNAHDFALYAAAVCGIMMVAGSIWLLRVGVIELTRAAHAAKAAKKKRAKRQSDPDAEQLADADAPEDTAVSDAAPALTVEIADKIKISTTYPALALFVIGLLFVSLSVWFGRTPPPLNVVGTIPIENASRVATVTLLFDESFNPDSDGKIDKILSMDVKRLKVVVNAAGYDEQPWTGTLRVEDAKQQRIAFDAPKFKKLNSPKPVPGDIKPIQGDQKVEPLHQPN